MADEITLKELQDASKDAKSLEEVVNGSDAKQVTTRLGENYPSVKKAIKTLFENGGLPATPFATKALMSASALVDGDYAMITDSGGDDGLYIKLDGIWVNSSYDPLKKSINYTNIMTAGIDSEVDAYLDVASDKLGMAYRYTDTSGGLSIVGLSEGGTVQDNINHLQKESKRIPVNSIDNRIATIIDAKDNIVSYYDDESNLHIRGRFISNGVDISSSKNTSVGAVSKSAHQSILLHSMPAVNNLITIHGKDEDGDGLHKRMPFGITTPTGLLCFYHRRTDLAYDGDSTGSELWKAVVTINDDLTATVNSKALFLAPDAPRGIVKHPTLGRTSDGRILLIYEKRLESTDAYTQYQCYSSDEGVTFTAPTPLVLSGANPSSGGGTNALGTTGAIVSLDNGRLIVPMYTGSGICFCIYSDDDGASWAFSDAVSMPLESFEPSIIIDLNNNLLMDMRPERLAAHRERAVSYDNGESWQYATNDMGVVRSGQNQGVLLKDDRLGLIMQTHSDTGWERTNFTISLSYDNAKTFPYKYSPLPLNQYSGYSQLIKFKEGVYLLLIENAAAGSVGNQDENVKLAVITLSEVISNVRSY